MFRLVARLTLVIVAAAAVSCTSVGYPTFTAQRSLLPGVGDGRVERHLEARIALPYSPRAALVWLDPVGSPWPLSRTEAYTRAGVLPAVRDTLRDAGLSHVYVVPTVPAQLSRERDGAADLRDLRSAAARFQADVLLILQTETHEGREQNILAFTYIGLLPALFVPGERADIKLAAELCAVHVATGALLGCTTGRASRGAEFMTLGTAGARRSEMREAGLVGAVSEAARGLRMDLDIHRGRGRG